MKRHFRLTKRSDLERVRRLGKSYAHPLIVLVALPNDMNLSRFAFIAAKSIGSAVHRNWIKRRLRAAISLNISKISPGFDIILIARKPLNFATYPELETAILTLFSRAQLSPPSDKLQV